MSLWGALWWYLVPVRRAEAVANYRAAFPDRDPRELIRAMDEIATSYLDLLAGRRAELLDGHLLRGGAVGLCGHGVGWDMALISVAEAVPVTAFVREPSNPVAAWLVRRLRKAGDLELLPPRDSMAAAYAALERGRLVTFIQDQRHNAGLAVPFFGRAARTSPAFAAMAWRTRAPLLGGWPRRDDDGRYRVQIETLPFAVPEDRDEAIRSLTADTQAWYEAKIRQRPYNWLWLHRRWR